MVSGVIRAGNAEGFRGLAPNDRVLRFSRLLKNPRNGSFSADVDFENP
jgi:hypothetical protein